MPVRKIEMFEKENSPNTVAANVPTTIVVNDICESEKK